MTELQKQVQRAQRRINFQSFLAACTWCVAVTLSIAALAIGVSKIWHLGVDSAQWSLAWLVGSVATGVITAGAWTWFTRDSMVQAAIEIDKRYGLKERVSSSLALSPDEAQTDVGKALVADAAKRVERIDVREQFGVKANRWAALPFLTGALALGLVFLPDAKPGSSDSEANAKTVEVKQVKKSTEALQKKLAKKSKELEGKDLKEASKLAQQLERGIDELSKKDGDKKKAMVEMNNLAKSLRDRRKSMQGSEELKKKLNQLKGMKVQDGPADKLAKALQNGDFKSALDQIKDLQQQLKDGNLNPQQMEKLAKQMDQMQKKMNEMVQRHEQAKENLQKQIDEARKQGDTAAARKLEKKLEQLQAQDEAMKKMQQMASQMQQMSESMKEGDPQQAAQQLQQMSQELQEMQRELDELQAMDELMDQLADAKNSMNCPDCDGSGCPSCQGFGFGEMPGEMPGQGLGDGQGRGDRPEEETDSNFYDSKVKANVGKGKMVLTGSVRGPNKPGDALEAIKEAMAAASTSDENPLTNVRMPKAQLEQAEQYFNSVRDAK